MSEPAAVKRGGHYLRSGDSSILPGVGGANPTLTVQAVAARTADRIAGRYFS